MGWSKKTLRVDGTSDRWRTRFADLLRYKEVHGNCDVPAKWKEDKKLSNWVSQQRHNYNRGSLHVTRVKLLEEAGFSWHRYSRNGRSDIRRSCSLNLGLGIVTFRQGMKTIQVLVCGWWTSGGLEMPVNSTLPGTLAGRNRIYMGRAVAQHKGCLILALTVCLISWTLRSSSGVSGATRFCATRTRSSSFV